MMKITGFHIDGFGVFCDFGVRDLGDGLTVFYGPNEAGKSTLLDFLRYTMFGYPPRRTKRNLHKPLRGGRHGGRLQLAQDGQTMTLERRPNEPPLLDGIGREEVLWRARLHGMTLDTFVGYWAFDRSEFDTQRDAPPADIEAMLLGAGQTGRLRSPSSVCTRLRQEMDGLYKKRGRIQPIAVELDQLRDLHHEITQAQRRPREYEEKQQHLEGIEERLLATSTRIRRLRSEVERDRQLLGMREAFLRWREARDAFERTEKIEEFPVDGVVRLERLDRDMAELTHKSADRGAELERLKERRAREAADWSWLACEPRIDRLLRDRAACRKGLEHLEQLEQEQAVQTREVQQGLERLGAGWTPAAVRTVETHLVAQDRVREPIEQRRRLEQDLANEVREILQEEQQLALLAAQRQPRGSAVVDASETLETLRQRLGALDEWLELDNERLQAVQRVASLARELARMQVDVAERDEQLERLTGQEFSPRRWRLLAIGAVAALLGGLAALVSFELAAGIVLLAVAASLLLAARRARLSLAERVREAVGQRAQLGVIQRKALTELARAEHERKGAREAQAALQEKLAATASRANLPSGADRATVRETRRRFEEQREQAVEAMKVREGLRQIELQQAEASRRLEERRAREAGLRQELEQVERDVRGALQSVGLPPMLSPSTALEAFSQIRQLQRVLAQSDPREQEIEAERRSVEAFAARVGAVASERGLAAVDGWAGTLEELERRMQQEKRAAERERETDQQIALVRQDLERLDEQLARAQEERTKLLAAGGAPDAPEVFRRRFEKARLFQQARERLNEALAALDAHRPSSEPAKQFAERLEQTDWPAVEPALAELEEELGQAEEEDTRLREQRGRLTLEIEQMEGEEKLFDLRQGEEASRARLLEMTRRWNVLAVTEALLRQVQEIYDRERQPWRIRRASELLRRFTRGGLERIHLRDDGGIMAVRPNLTDLRPEHMSTGTRDQLYLSMRLALVDEMAARGVMLPMLFDDILINFDDERARATAETLAELAADRQLWYFTAHQPTLALWRQIGIAREVALERLV